MKGKIRKVHASEQLAAISPVNSQPRGSQLSSSKINEQREAERRLQERKRAFLAIAEDLEATEREYRENEQLKAEKLANIGTSCFKATVRNKDWYTLTHTVSETPSACRYSPSHSLTKPDHSGYAGYREDTIILANGRSPSNKRDAWLGPQPCYNVDSSLAHVGRAKSFKNMRSGQSNKSPRAARMAARNASL